MKKVLMVAVAVAFVTAMAMAADEKAPAAAPAKDAPKAMHCISMKDGVAMCCTCAADCAKCGEVKDGKCGCGKDVVKVDLTGKFVCEKCKTISDKAGKCKCGADLVEVKAKAKDEAK